MMRGIVKNKYSLIVLLLLLEGCNLSSQLKLDYDTDLSAFFSSMREGDTLKISVNLSIGNGHAFEENLLYKDNNELYIQTYIWDYISEQNDNYQRILAPVRYFQQQDTLSIEWFYDFLKYEPKKESLNKNLPRFVFIYKNDTVNFYIGGGEYETINFLIPWGYIKRNLYPNEILYNSPEIPPPPPN